MRPIILLAACTFGLLATAGLVLRAKRPASIRVVGQFTAEDVHQIQDAVSGHRRIALRQLVQTGQYGPALNVAAPDAVIGQIREVGIYRGIVSDNGTPGAYALSSAGTAARPCRFLLARRATGWEVVGFSLQ